MQSAAVPLISRAPLVGTFMDEVLWARGFRARRLPLASTWP